MHNVGVGLMIALAFSAVVLVAVAQKPCPDTLNRIEAATKQRQ